VYEISSVFGNFSLSQTGVGAISPRCCPIIARSFRCNNLNRKSRRALPSPGCPPAKESTQPSRPSTNSIDFKTEECPPIQCCHFITGGDSSEIRKSLIQGVESQDVIVKGGSEILHEIGCVHSPACRQFLPSTP
jgi:hypothetical protein